MICLCGGRMQSTTRTLKTRAAQLDWHQTPTACWTHSASLLSLRGIGYTPLGLDAEATLLRARNQTKMVIHHATCKDIKP